jgi:hypothetical protein
MINQIVAGHKVSLAGSHDEHMLERTENQGNKQVIGCKKVLPGPFSLRIMGHMMYLSDRLLFTNQICATSGTRYTCVPDML